MNLIAATHEDPDLKLGTSEISFRGVAKAFASPDGDRHLAVRGIDLEIEAGTFVAVIGPSGCGKSTLLNMAAGLMAPTAGLVFYRGQKITRVNRDVGYITQHNNLLPWRTVEKNVRVALELRKVPRRQANLIVADALELVGLAKFARRYPSQLSGGMQKRVALARTLVYDPHTLLMDEPFGPLDAQLRLSMQRELLSLWERDKKTVIFVTHDLEEAMLLADRVAVFSPSPGTIIHVEQVPFERPRDLVSLRGDPQFAAMWERLWQYLEPMTSEGVKR